jgi:hypothetical protein
VCEKAKTGKTMADHKRAQKPDRPMSGKTNSSISGKKKQKMNNLVKQLSWARGESLGG